MLKKSTNQSIAMPHVPTAILVTGFVGSAAVAVIALRSNNMTMLRLRSKLEQADKENGDVEVALRELRSFVAQHMNTNLSSGRNAIKPPIQLKYTYERLVEAEKHRATSNNAKVNLEAQDVCQKQFGAGQVAKRLQCVSDYNAAHGSTTSEQTIPASYYKFDFVSPRWSPDVAGWSIIVCSLLLFWLVGRTILELFIKRRLAE